MRAFKKLSSSAREDGIPETVVQSYEGALVTGIRTSAFLHLLFDHRYEPKLSAKALYLSDMDVLTSMSPWQVLAISDDLTL